MTQFLYTNCVIRLYSKHAISHYRPTGRRHPICLHVITKFPFNYAMVGLTRPSFCHMTLSTKTVGYFAHNFLNSCSSQWPRKVIPFLRAWTVVVLLPTTSTSQIIRSTLTYAEIYRVRMRKKTAQLCANRMTHAEFFCRILRSVRGPSA